MLPVPVKGGGQLRVHTIAAGLDLTFIIDAVDWGVCTAAEIVVRGIYAFKLQSAEGRIAIRRPRQPTVLCLDVRITRTWNRGESQ